ncbi:GAF domain-containing sensor histidine kinase [Actinopolymorpha pittospori]|uniref:Oxygen sensor histidine kinase NreB n=1 Tax=Actinopolymorpha pittospori TaxID=648752 RepID=A0A927RGB2_9ACTN|nr:GAF domain-containing sensor histidine kinase [Actinopolymorpha pittospori]MBE1611010.1 signal transduction histidine kinase [Actinopolymorpha pittospori]
MAQPDPTVCRDDLDALSRALLAVTEQTATREVMQMIVESARTLVRSDYSALGLPDERGRFAEFYASGVSDEQWREIGPVPRAHGLLSVMMREAAPYRTSDVKTDERFSGWPSAHPDMRGFLGVPIVDRGEILGAVYVANGPDAPEFSADDERLLGILAAHAAIALTRARMFERDRELTLAEERSRIARDLHDAVAQKLFSLRLTVGAAEALALKGDPERAREQFTRVKELAGSALDELRAVVTELRPPAVREDGLVPALRKHVAVISRAHTVAVRFDSDCDGRCELGSAVEDAVFRVAQEALHNALRHADATTVDITLRTPEEAVVLEVADDGKGFVADPAKAGGHHLGITSMRERARQAGGRLRVESDTGAGTTIRLEIPRD